MLGSSRVACILARKFREAEVVEIFIFETLDLINMIILVGNLSVVTDRL